MKHLLIYLSVAAVLWATEIIGIKTIMNDHSNSVVTIGEVKKPGYEKIPGYANVSASPSKVWHDVVDSALIILVVFGFVLAVATTVMAFLFDGSQSKGGGPWAIFVCGAISLLFVFGPYAAKKSGSVYETRICLDKYEQNKSNLDALFPAVDTGEFLNGCK